MRKRRTFTPEMKANIVLEALQSSKTHNEIARTHQLSPGVLDRWKKKFLNNASQVFEKHTQEKEKDRKIKKYEHVITKITTQNDFLERVLASLE